ncbi:hypothetical protein E2C01_065360 [Portunus trituberculatus]|uniref:Uncharacterized protein n=1 Tax=Portunus trituberculatus TaxID=210409 RepID=A0A5B7HEB5_PORTR|nr:hypothetical protein [Portunus trituberculatus]
MCGEAEIREVREAKVPLVVGGGEEVCGGQQRNAATVADPRPPWFPGLDHTSHKGGILGTLIGYRSEHSTLP